MPQENNISLHQCEQISQWLSEQSLASEIMHQLTLPEQLAGKVADKKVYFFKNEKGDTFILLKTEIGWKENFVGTFFSSRKLLSTEIILNQDRDYLSIISTPLFEELFLKQELEGNRYEVYFDLN